jgi:hypothetical protein
MKFDEWLVRTAIKDIEHYISTDSDADISYSHYLNGQYRTAYNLYKQFIKETSEQELKDNGSEVEGRKRCCPDCSHMRTVCSSCDTMDCINN